MRWVNGELFLLPSAECCADEKPTMTPDPEVPQRIDTSPQPYTAVFWATLILHIGVFIAALALVSVLFGSNHTTALVVRGYMLAPADASCLAWLDGDCVSENDGMRWEALQGVMPVSEHRARGLFADVNPAIACLVAQSAILTTHPTLPSKVGAGVLVCVSVLLLFMQGPWQLGFGSLLWSELVLAAAFFAKGYGQLEAVPVLSLPTLAVASLALAGENDASALILVYFSLGAMLLMARHFHVSDLQEGFNMWLCVLPFVLRVALRLQAIMVDLPVDAPGWICGALIFALVWIVLLVGGLRILDVLPPAVQYGLFVTDQVAHATLVLLILVGLMGTA